MAVGKKGTLRVPFSLASTLSSPASVNTQQCDAAAAATPRTTRCQNFMHVYRFK